MNQLLAAAVLFLILLLAGCTDDSGSTASQPTDNNPLPESLANAPSAVETVDVATEYESSPQFLGNPYFADYPDDPFARNIWDLETFADRLFLGAGNSANTGPSRNMGPVAVISFDGEQFVTEYEVDDEQIALFRVVDDRLYIPGHDALQSWDYGNIYRRGSDASSWEKLRTIAEAVHVLDLLLFGDRLFAAVGAAEDGQVAISDDGGEHWLSQSLGDGRIYNLLPVADTLFAVKKIPVNYPDYRSVLKYQPESDIFTELEIGVDELLPGTEFGFPLATLHRITVVGEKSYFIGAEKYDDFHPLPLGLYVATYDGELDVERIPLKSGVVPRDLLIDGELLYLLTSSQGRDGVQIEVLRMNLQEGEGFESVISFDYDSFARSFALLNRDLYFAIGCDLNDREDLDAESNDHLPAVTGDILRIRAINNRG
ncbi:MAG: hypothetical protein HQL48_00730 [Gammaproteobacteria bacterium]|nr:hypothetical protein [Gammaproteobacteria bacterium]